MIKISRRLDYPKSHIIIVGLLIYTSFLGVATISPGEASSKKKLQFFVTFDRRYRHYQKHASSQIKKPLVLDFAQ